MVLILISCSSAIATAQQIELEGHFQVWDEPTHLPVMELPNFSVSAKAAPLADSVTNPFINPVFSLFHFQVDIPSTDLDHPNFQTFQTSENRLEASDPTANPSFQFMLPLDLTGGVAIQAKFQRVDNVSAQVHLGHLSFKGSLGGAACMGDWYHLTCQINLTDFYKLGLDIDKVENYLYFKYGPGQNTDSRLLAAKRFLNAPMAVIQINPIDQNCQSCSIGNGLWDTKIIGQTGFDQPAELWIDFEEGYYYSRELRGRWAGLAYDGKVLRGTWLEGQGSGWFELEFTDSSHFKGSWGSFLNPNLILGEWQGTRLF